jgi:hypothetical protein
VQYWAATIFWISGYCLSLFLFLALTDCLCIFISFTAIPEIQTAIMPKQGLLDGVFWTPQVIGGSGFIIAS